MDKIAAYQMLLSEHPLWEKTAQDEPAMAAEGVSRPAGNLSGIPGLYFRPEFVSSQYEPEDLQVPRYQKYLQDVAATSPAGVGHYLGGAAVGGAIGGALKGGLALGIPRMLGYRVDPGLAKGIVGIGTGIGVLGGLDNVYGARSVEPELARLALRQDPRVALIRKKLEDRDMPIPEEYDYPGEYADE
jgi:hypothetical protein